MKIGLIITNGDNEHPCFKYDNGQCSQTCPNLVTKEGYTCIEALQLNRPLTSLRCAVIKQVNPDISKIKVLC
jgi:excinuclease UvrABC nuclease subunit